MDQIIDAFEYVQSKFIAHFLYLRHKLAIVIRSVIDVAWVHLGKYLLKWVEYSLYWVTSLIQVLTDFLD